jgi:hypothetical protein
VLLSMVVLLMVLSLFLPPASRNDRARMPVASAAEGSALPLLARSRDVGTGR